MRQMTPRLLGLKLKDRAVSADRGAAPPYCLFLGAGTDIEAGGLTFLELKREALRQFDDRPHVDALDPLALDREFDLFLTTRLSSEDRPRVVDALFNRYERLRPSEAHILTVLMCKYGLIDAVVTTNFDTLIERAEAQTGGRVFEIFAPGVALPDTDGDRVIFPPRPILLKLHGDLASRTITHLSRAETAGRPYCLAFERLLTQILQSHRLIFVGYSGYDEVVADAARAAGGVGQVYWVNRCPPSPDAPVAAAIGPDRIAYVESAYSNFIEEAAQEALKDLDVNIAGQGVFLPSLVAERIRAANDRFFTHHLMRGADRHRPPFVPRRPVESLISRFRNGRDKPLMIIASPSGCGKSSLVARLWHQQKESSFPPLLILRAQSMSEADVAARVLRELESGPGDAVARMYQFASWLRATDRELLIVLDGANEFSPQVEQVARLVRSVIEILLRIRNHRSVKVLITVRQEVWNDAFRLLDASELARVLWTADEREDRPNAVALGHFTPEEAEEAFAEYADTYQRPERWADLAPTLRAEMRDPFLMGLAMSDGAPLSGPSISRKLVERAVVHRIAQQVSPLRANSLLSALESAAAAMLRAEAARIGEAMLEEAGVAADERALLVDADILARGADGRFDFVHDRFAEIFFARAIERQRAIRLRDLEGLCESLRDADRMPWLRGALVSSFAAAPVERLAQYRALLDQAFAFVGAHLGGGSADVRRLHSFLKDVLLEMAAHSPDRYADLFGSRLSDQSTPAFARPLLVQAAGLLPQDRAFSAWIEAMRTLSGSAAVEVETLLYDRIAKSFAGSWRLSLSPLDRSPLSEWFGDAESGGLVTFCRTALLASRLGPDNLSEREWDAFSAELAARLRRIAARTAIPGQHEARLAWIAPLGQLSAIDANRFLFNALPDWLDQYYMDPARAGILSEARRRLDSGLSLAAEDFLAIAPAAAEIGLPVRFLIANLLYARSYRIDAQSTEAELAQALDRLPPGVPVEQLDLLLSCVFMGRALNRENAFPSVDAFTRKIAKRFPQSYLDNPGQRRAMQHGIFRDDFDQQFEDGFNPLAIYFYHAPCEWRKNVSYARSANPAGAVPLYSELLDEFERENVAKGVIRIVHALGQMASLWPDCAMEELLRLTGRREPTIRRSLVRVLAECFRRFPQETVAMIARSGAAFSPEERYLIECAGDSRISQRTFEQLQWSRILLVLESAACRDLLRPLTAALIDCTSWAEAMLSAAEALLEAVGHPPPAGQG